jgi:hypothetical protein
MKIWAPELSKVYLAIIIVGLIGGFTILYATSLEPWVSDDSVGYIENARSLVAGDGLGFYRASGEFRPLSYHPPLYSLALSIAGFLKLDYLIFARLLNATLFASMIILSGWATYTALSHQILSVSLSLVVLTTPIFIMNFSGVMSEALLFTLGLAGIALLSAHLRRGERHLLVLSSFVIGFSVLARYSGAAFLIAGGTGLLFLDGNSFKHRLRKSISFLVIGIVPISIWLAIQKLFYPSASPGLFHFDLANIWSAFTPVRLALVDIIWEWSPVFSWFSLTTYRIRLILIGIVFLVMTGLIMLAIRKLRSRESTSWLRNNRLRFFTIFGIFTLSYILVVTTSYIFVSFPQPALNDRIFSPILLGIIFTLISSLYFLTDAWPSQRILKALPVFVTILFIATNIPKSLELARDLSQNSSGFTNSRWSGSGVIQDVLQLPPDTKLISNEIYAIMFYTHRPAHTLPELSRDVPLEDFYSFGDDPNDNVQEIFREQGAALVLFQEIYWQLLPIYQEVTDERLEALTDGLSVHSERWDGAIYFYGGNE